MRIIAGKYKGRKLESPVGRDVRPTSDKVREAVFSSLQAEIPDAVCVDLFAGSGAIGIEALSRGAKRVYFGDASKESMELTKRNCRTVGCSNDAIFFTGEWQRVLPRIADEAAGRVDVVFIDPPYKAGIYEAVLAEIARLGLLAEGAVLMLEHDRRDALPESIAGFRLLRERDYGKTAVSYYGF